MSLTLVAALVLAHLAQSAVIVVIVELALRRPCYGDAAARLRLASWGFFGAAALPLAGLLLPSEVGATFGPYRAPLFHVQAIVVRSEAIGAGVHTLAGWALLALGLGCAIRIARTLIAAWRGEQIVARAAPVSASQYGLPASARLAADDSVPGPLVAGLLTPVIVVPRRLLKESPEHVRAVLLHEFSHVERNDVGRALRQRIVEDLYWWNPFMWNLARRLREEREFACDEAAACGRDAVDVASALLREARAQLTASPRAHALGAASESGLGRRVERLLNKPKPLSAALVIALAGALLVAGSLTPRSPETGRTHIGIAHS